MGLVTISRGCRIVATVPEDIGQQVRRRLASDRQREGRSRSDGLPAIALGAAFATALVLLAHSRGPGLLWYGVDGAAIAGLALLSMAISRWSAIQGRRSQGSQSVDLVKAHQELWQMATRDELTHLYNRRYLFQRVEEEMEAARIFRRPLALVLADADHLKAINDGYGHRAGDEALEQIGKALARQVRLTDVAARIGGDEFAILVSHTDRQGAEILVERLRREAVGRVCINGGSNREPACLTLSFGVAAFPEDGKTPDALFAEADSRLYADKELRPVRA